MSDVILVIIVEVPSVSISVKDRLWICPNRACFNFVEKPTAAFAAKYCAVMEQTSPTIPRLIRIRPMRSTYPLSPVVIPLSMMAATTSGTNSSKAASSILKRGASADSFL